MPTDPGASYDPTADAYATYIRPPQNAPGGYPTTNVNQPQTAPNYGTPAVNNPPGGLTYSNPGINAGALPGPDPSKPVLQPGYNASTNLGATQYFTPDASKPSYGITLDPAQANTDSYIQMVGQDAAKALGQPFDANSFNSYWLPKIKAGGGMTQYWLDRLLGGGSGSTDTSSQTKTLPPGSGYAPGVGVPGMGTVFGGGTPGQDPKQSAALFNLLMGIATGSSPESANPNLTINPNDPIIKAQVDAYNVQQQQAERNYLSDVAEKGGGGNINMDAVNRSAEEQIGQNTSTFQAGLMANELQARRAEISQALSGAQGFLTAEQQMQLEEELNQLGLAEQAYQFDTTNQFNNSPLVGGG